MFQLSRPRHILVMTMLLLIVSSLHGETRDDDSEEPEPEEGDVDDSGEVAGGAQFKNVVAGQQVDDVDPEDAFIWPTTEEERQSEGLPAAHNCNGCKGVAYQIDTALKALQPLDGPRRTLAEHEYTEAMECRPSIYDRYGLKKLADRTRALVGPGLAYWDNKEGSTFEGARWPGRMARHCGEIVGDFEDEETDVYRMWTETEEQNGYTKFAAALCGPMCGEGPRKKITQPEKETEEEERMKKKKAEPKKVEPKKPAPKKAAPKKQEESLDGAPQVKEISQKTEINQLVAKKHKLVFLLFCAPSFKRCGPLEKEFEKAARGAKKVSEMKKDVLFVKANTDDVGTFDFEVERSILPAFLLFRRGYAAPKGILPEDMLKLREAGDFLNFIQEELNVYLQDDPERFPRGKLEL